MKGACEREERKLRRCNFRKKEIIQTKIKKKFLITFDNGH